MYVQGNGGRKGEPACHFFNLLQAFKEKFNPKDKNHALFGILLTQIMRNVGIDVFEMEPSARASAEKGNLCEHGDY